MPYEMLKEIISYIKITIKIFFYLHEMLRHLLTDYVTNEFKESELRQEQLHIYQVL